MADRDHDDKAGPDGRAGIDAALVARLIAGQFPDWADLPIRPVPIDGNDNRTYRLGSELSVRLPTAPGYVAAVQKEDHWLPRLAPRLPVAVPSPVAIGQPSAGYDHPWSIRRWIDGDTALARSPVDRTRFAQDLAGFLLALQAIDATGGPAPGPHCFHRGGPPHSYDDETQQALSRLTGLGLVDTEAAAQVWAATLSADPWHRAPVWFHGDVAVGNLILQQDRLAAVIDFGTCGVGDPACDLVISWSVVGPESGHDHPEPVLDPAARAEFRRLVGGDAALWARARGWALWKALIVLAEAIEGDHAHVEPRCREIELIIADAAGT